ncbi:MAG TPA: PaaI family thioesterase [Gaiellaceae bacterium]
MEITLAQLEEMGSVGFPGMLGIEFEMPGEGVMHAHLEIAKKHLSPNGYLHAGTVVGLADSTAGYGCMLNLPEGGIGFTTIELKTNFLRSSLSGRIDCEARLAHGGRTTQIWDATVTDADGKTMALFRCTQLILRERV